MNRRISSNYKWGKHGNVWTLNYFHLGLVNVHYSPALVSSSISYYCSYFSQNPMNSDSPSTLLIEILSAKVRVSCRFYVFYSCLFSVEQSLMHFFKLIICLQFFAKDIHTREKKNCLYRRCQIKRFALIISSRVIIYGQKNVAWAVLIHSIQLDQG